jgi:hypothetical protein
MVNPYFLAKFGLMAIAGVNMVLFHQYVSKDMDSWGVPGALVPLNAKIAGVVSLALWVAIPFCGRITGFTLGVYVPA